jgi:sorbitol-specific phosphotransferase system component IIA
VRAFVHRTLFESADVSAGVVINIQSNRSIILQLVPDLSAVVERIGHILQQFSGFQSIDAFFHGFAQLVAGED